MMEVGGGSDRYLVEVGEDAELGAHLWYGSLELLDPPFLLRLLLSRHSPLALNRQTGFRRTFTYPLSSL